METVEAYVTHLMDTGEIPQFITIEEAKGRVFSQRVYFKDDYMVILFEPSSFVIATKRLKKDWKFIENVFDETSSYDWYRFLRILIPDEEKANKFYKRVEVINSRIDAEKDYQQYLKLKEKYEKKTK